MGGCSDVCLDQCYDESNEFYSDKMVVARKQHKCCECFVVIEVGQRYERVAGKTFGDKGIWSVATCATCTEIRKAFVCGSWEFGSLWQSMAEGMFPVWETHSAIDCLAKLETLEARNKCREKYAEWKR